MEDVEAIREASRRIRAAVAVSGRTATAQAKAVLDIADKLDIWAGAPDPGHAFYRRAVAGARALLGEGPE